MAWPGSTGGAQSPNWGDTVALFIRMAIAPGNGFTMGLHANDRLNAGNVMGHVTTGAPLWVDVACDVLSLELDQGARQVDGVIAKPEAATCRIVLRDPTRKYDPLNTAGPFVLNGDSRLVPGTPIQVFAETLTSPTTTTAWPLFTGTVDTWAEDWTPHASERRAEVVASDATKLLANLDFGEQSPQGNGEFSHQRIQRILAHYGWTGLTNLQVSAVKLQQTTLAQSAWELLQRVADDEVGFLYFDANGTLQFIARTAWEAGTTTAITVGCPGGLDIVTDATVLASSLNLHNLISAARSGGVTQTARNEASIAKYGTFGLSRTDLGLFNDSVVAEWATFLLQMSAIPRAQLLGVNLVPRFDPNSWDDVLAIRIMKDLVRVVWVPPGAASGYQASGLVVGTSHTVTRQAWDVQWRFIQANLMTRTFHMGAHPDDFLDSNRVLAA